MSMEHHEMYQPLHLRWRRRLVVGAMALGALAIVGRLAMIQLSGRSELLERAEQQYRARIRIQGERGAILDRNGVELASSVAAVSLALDPKVVRSPARIAALLERLGLAHANDIIARVEAARDRNFVWLVRGLPLPMAAAFDTLNDPGLLRIREHRRSYVHDWMAAPLIGTTNVDGRGIAGIELAYDSLLQGSVGERIMERVGRGRLRPSLEDNPLHRARPGATIELTIDWQLEQLVETELAKSVAATGAAAGTVIVIRPQTGELVACAQQPSFVHSQRSDPDALRLRATSDMYEPGSTFKAIVAAAALDARRATADRVFDGHNGFLRLADGRTITDHEPLGLCTLADALAHSSNIIFAELAAELGARTLYRYARDFGIGLRTEVGLAGEARGVLKLPRDLRGSDLLFLGFGYGVACTPLQLAYAYAAIANGGVLMQPYIVRRIASPSGEELYRAAPQRRRRVISDSTAAVLRRLLAGVIERGTGTNARIEGMPVAGKTGTAQQWSDGMYSKRDYTASFVGMVPVEQPQLVVLVMLDRPRTDIYGGNTAAPLFRRIIQTMMNLPQLATRYGLDSVHGGHYQHDSVLVPDIRGLTLEHAERILRAVGLRVRSDVGASGHIVVTQQPPQASRVLRGSELRVRLASVELLRQEPPLVGLPLRNALACAHALGLPVAAVHGSGWVRSYRWDSTRRLVVTAAIP